MTAQKKEKRNTKQEIFLVAAEMFADKGYANVSAKDIATRIGIRAASIYNHYPSKEDILDALLDHYLDRMEFFYTRLAEAEFDTSDQKDLGQALSKLMLSYEPYEVPLMYQLTRIIHHEQFASPKAAEALIGSGYKKHVGAHIRFFDRLTEAGLIQGRENNRYYGELYARLSLTFATQFLHPEIEPTIADQTELNNFITELILSYERRGTHQDLNAK